jgi:hypothetical protein
MQIHKEKVHLQDSSIDLQVRNISRTCREYPITMNKVEETICPFNTTRQESLLLSSKNPKKCLLSMLLAENSKSHLGFRHHKVINT